MADTQINVKIVGSSNSAEQALDRVAKKAEQSLGKSISDSLDNVKAKAQKVFGVEIPGLMNAAKSGAAFAGAAIGIEAAGRALKDMAVSAIKTTDQLTQLRARINLINDGTQSTAEIMDKVYQAANRSRGSYLDMADSVAKLNMLAKDAFNSNDEAIYLEGFLKAGVSGLIIEGTKSSFPNPNIRLYKEIEKKGIPTIFIHNHYSNQNFSSIEMSDAEAGYELTKYLIKNGHKRIGGMFKYDDIQGQERYKGFIECLSDYGVKFDDDYIRWHSTKDMDETISFKGLTKMYKRTRDCTAMIMYNDEIADYYLEFLEGKGILVPRDLSLVSFDDARLAEHGGLKILSAIHPKFDLGRLAAKNLIKMLGDRHWKNKNYSHKFPVVLNDGNSVRDIKEK